MKQTIKIFGALLMGFVCLAMGSCRQGSGDGLQVESVTITASAESVLANGRAKVVLTVEADGSDVTSLATIEYAFQESTRTEDSYWSPLNGNEFSTLQEGTYIFRATYKGVHSQTTNVEAISAESRFERHICLMDFTSASCTNCPQGMRNINARLQFNSKLRNSLHIMGMHCSYYTDVMQIDVADEIYAAFRCTVYPSFLIDMRDAGPLTSEGMDAMDKGIERSFEEYPAHSDVALVVTYDEATRQGSVEATVFSESDDNYRLALYIVEDNVKGYQKDGSLSFDDYNHRHVVRQMVSNSFMGDSLGNIGREEEKSTNYNFTIDEGWNAEKVEIYALLFDGTQTVNNVAVCALNSSVDYKYIEE